MKKLTLILSLIFAVTLSSCKTTSTSSTSSGSRACALYLGTCKTTSTSSGGYTFDAKKAGLKLSTSSTSSGEWTKFGVRSNGDTLYVNFNTIKKEDGFVIFTALQDNLRRQKSGAMSGIVLAKGDCDKLRWKVLRMTSYKKPMGEDVKEVIEEESPWFDLTPNSYQGKMVQKVCNH